MDAAFIKKMANKIDTKNLAPKKTTLPPSKRVEEVQDVDDDDDVLLCELFVSHSYLSIAG